MSTMIPQTVICSECSTGSYREDQPGSSFFTCTECGHEVTWSDMLQHGDDVSGDLAVNVDGTMVAYFPAED